MIPKTIAFFWCGDKLSWMRYLTLQSFSKLNPDWEMVLYRVPYTKVKEPWVTAEVQDFQEYDGADYFDDLDFSNLKVHIWEPAFDISGLSPVQLSDLFQWWWLSTSGGFYSDMDILFVQSLARLYEKIKNAQVAWFTVDRTISIGFLAGTPDNPFYADILQTALKAARNKTYQCAGADAVLSTIRFQNQLVQQVPAKQPTRQKKFDVIISTDFALIFAEQITRKYWVKTTLILDEYGVYPFNSNEVIKIFGENLELSKDCVGIHWYGGNLLSQRWNNFLGPTNYHGYNTTFCRYAHEILNDYCS